MHYLVLLAPFAAAALALRARDRGAAMVVFFTYLSIEGLLKLLANYHPIIHIGLDLLLAIIVAAWVGLAILRRDVHLPRVPLLFLVAAHVFWILLLTFSPYTASTYVAVASWKVHLTMIPLYFIGYTLAADPDAPRRFMRAMLIVWVVSFAFTGLQYVTGPSGIADLGDAYLRRSAYYHEWRPFGTTALPGGEAIFAFFAIPFALCLVFRGDYRLRNPWILAALAGGSMVFFVSGVRQVFLGCLIILFTMVLLQLIRGRGIAAAALAATLSVGGGVYVVVREYILPQAMAAIRRTSGAPELWRERDPVRRFGTLLELETYLTARGGGLHLIWDRASTFPFGAGLGRTGAAAGALREELTRDPLGKLIQDRYGFQDNFFAAMLVETGIPGTVMLTAVLLGIGLLSLRLARRAPAAADAAFGAMASGVMAALLVMSWGSQPLLANPTLAFFWFIGGLVAGRYRAAVAPEPQPMAEPGVPAPEPEPA